MRHRWIRVVLWLLLVAAGLLTAMVCAIPPAERAWQHRQVEAAIARFEASPSQQGVDELTGLPDRQIPTPEQGEQVLKLLFYPRAIARTAYPVGRRPSFSAERPFL